MALHHTIVSVAPPAARGAVGSQEDPMQHRQFGQLAAGGGTGVLTGCAAGAWPQPSADEAA
jgi:hypothetical protein